MKRIVVTGKNGSISLAFRQYMDRFSNYQVEYLSLRDENWRDFNFSDIDCVFHCAGIINPGKGDWEELWAINVELSKELFRVVRDAKVDQFIYLSSMAVYDFRETGRENSGVIDEKRQPDPQTLYGRSKYEAELAIMTLANTKTKVAIIRPPSIVGRGTEGYFDRLERVLKLPFFPMMFTDDKRSFLHVDCLCELTRLITDEGGEGVFLPQNLPLLSICETIAEISQIHGRRLLMPKLPRWLWLRCRFTKHYFGSTCYTRGASSCFDNRYCLFDSFSAIEITLNEKKEIKK